MSVSFFASLVEPTSLLEPTLLLGSIFSLGYVLLWSWLQTFNANPSRQFMQVWGLLILHYLGYSMPWWALVCLLSLWQGQLDAVAAIPLLLTICVYFYATVICPNQLVVRNHHIDVGLEQPLKLAVFSDLHMGLFSGKPRHIRRLVNRLDSLSVDAIVMAGDWLYHPAADLVGQLLLFKSIDTPIYTVMGDSDAMHQPQHRGQWLLEDSLPQAFIALGITDISHRCVDLPQAHLCGVDTQLPSHIAIKHLPVSDLPSDRPNNRHSDHIGALDKPLILLMHNPDAIEQLPNIQHPRPIVITGHTHGGQIRIPKFGGVWTFRGSEQGLLSGLYQHAKAQVFVTSGVGVSGVPFRLGVAPCIDVLHIH